MRMRSPGCTRDLSSPASLVAAASSAAKVRSIGADAAGMNRMAVRDGAAFACWRNVSTIVASDVVDRLIGASQSQKKASLSPPHMRARKDSCQSFGGFRFLEFSVSELIVSELFS